MITISRGLSNQLALSHSPCSQLSITLSTLALYLSSLCQPSEISRDFTLYACLSLRLSEFISVVSVSFCNYRRNFPHRRISKHTSMTRVRKDTMADRCKCDLQCFLRHWLLSSCIDCQGRCKPSPLDPLNIENRTGGGKRDACRID